MGDDSVQTCTDLGHHGIETAILIVIDQVDNLNGCHANRIYFSPVDTRHFGQHAATLIKWDIEVISETVIAERKGYVMVRYHRP